MTRAEERALEAYPEDISYSTVLERPFDYNGHQRMIFQKGYEQAEKDLIPLAQLWVDSGDANVMSFEQFLKCHETQGNK